MPPKTKPDPSSADAAFAAMSLEERQTALKNMQEALPVDRQEEAKEAMESVLGRTMWTPSFIDAELKDMRAGATVMYRVYLAKLCEGNKWIKAPLHVKRYLYGVKKETEDAPPLLVSEAIEVLLAAMECQARDAGKTVLRLREKKEILPPFPMIRRTDDNKGFVEFKDEKFVASIERCLDVSTRKFADFLVTDDGTNALRVFNAVELCLAQRQVALAMSEIALQYLEWCQAPLPEKDSTSWAKNLAPMAPIRQWLERYSVVMNMSFRFALPTSAEECQNINRAMWCTLNQSTNTDETKFHDGPIFGFTPALEELDDHHPTINRAMRRRKERLVEVFNKAKKIAAQKEEEEKEKEKKETTSSA